MKWNDWYIGAAFVVLLWVACVVIVAALGLTVGFPMVIVSHVLNILSLFFLMLALVFAGAGAGTVVAADLVRKGAHRA